MRKCDGIEHVVEEVWIFTNKKKLNVKSIDLQLRVRMSGGGSLRRLSMCCRLVKARMFMTWEPKFGSWDLPVCLQDCEEMYSKRLENICLHLKRIVHRPAYPLKRPVDLVVSAKSTHWLSFDHVFTDQLMESHGEKSGPKRWLTLASRWIGCLFLDCTKYPNLLTPLFKHTNQQYSHWFTSKSLQ